MCDRAGEHDAREGLAVGLGLADGLDQLGEFLTVVLRSSVEGLVITIHREYDIRFYQLKIFGHRGKSSRAGMLVGAVSGEAHVTEAQLQPLGLSLKKGLQPTIMLHAVGEAISDDGNHVAFGELEGRGVFMTRRNIDRLGHFLGLTLASVIGNRHFFTKVKIHRDFRRREIVLLKDSLTIGVEKGNREIGEPPIETITPVPNRNFVDGLGFTEIKLPPRVRLAFAGVSLPPFGVGRVLIPIDGPLGNTSGSDARLGGFPGFGNILTFADHFDLGQSKRFTVSGQFDANISRVWGCC